MPASRIFRPELFFRQIILLSAMAGILASRHFAPGLVVFILLLLHQQRKIVFIRNFSRSFLLLLCLLFAFAAGLFYAQAHAPVRKELPDWAVRASSPSSYMQELNQEQARFFRRVGEAPVNLPMPPTWWEVADNALPEHDSALSSLFKEGLRVTATVEEVQGMADRNLRLILKDVRPLDNAGLMLAADAMPLPGGLVFTWNGSLTPEGLKKPPAGLRQYGGDKTAETALLERRPVKGDNLELHLRLREQRSLQNPGLWETERYWADRDVWMRGWASGERAEVSFAEQGKAPSLPAIWRENLRIAVLQNLPRSGGILDAGAEFIPALLFGDKYLLDSRDTERFARATLSHSLALSGLHLGYAAALGYFAVFLLYRLRPGLGLRLPRAKASVLGGFVPALFYLWLGGYPPSLVRSFLMLVFLGLLLYTNRPRVLVDALLWALGVILLLNPAAMFDLRLQLSALSIAAIILAVPVVQGAGRLLGEAGKPGKRKDRTVFVSFARKIGRYFTSLLLISVIIQVVLAPLLVRSFGLFGLAMPLNVLWLPVLGGVVMPCSFLGLAASALGLEGLASSLFSLAVLPCGWLMRLLEALDTGGWLQAVYPLRPHWLSMAGYWFLLALLPAVFGFVRCRYGQKRQLPFGRGVRGGDNPANSTGAKVLGAQLICGVLLCVLPLFEPLHADGDVRLRLLDVGHGQAVLLEWPEGRLLLDGGGGSSPRFDIGKEVIAATLADNRLPRLDYMLASHLDMDHAQGLIFPLRHLRVGYYADNGQGADKNFVQNLPGLLEERGLQRHKLSAGDSLALDRAERARPGTGLSLEIVYPPALTNAVGNNASLVARLVWRGEGLALFCGDVEKSGQRAILRSLARKEDLYAQVLVLPHHGSASALLPDFYQAVRPSLALVSCSYGNSWNFPSPKVRESLREEEIPLLSTARGGQISVVWGETTGIRVSTARNGALRVPE